MQLSAGLISSLENLTSSLNTASVSTTAQDPGLQPMTLNNLPAGSTIVSDAGTTTSSQAPQTGGGGMLEVQADPSSPLYQYGQSLIGTPAGNAIQGIVNAPNAFAQTPIGGVLGNVVSFITGSDIPSGENLLWLGFFGVLLMIGVGGLVLTQPSVQQAVKTAAKGAVEA